MPLLKRQPFERQKPPEDLDAEEELFHCKLTGEVFRDYEEFFERVILCNSLVWTCELTGRPCLTYQEALDSEQRARNSLELFPESMKRPILFLSSLTQRGRLADMCDDVSAFVRQRYLKGEEVELTTNGHKLMAKIVEVIPPSPSMIKEHQEVKVKVEAKTSDKQEASPENNEKKVQLGPDPLLYKYIVKEVESGKERKATPGEIARKKGGFNRDRNKLFLKQYCESKDAVWKLKPSTISAFNIGALAFSDIFAGPLPNFCTTLSKKIISPNKDAEVNNVATVNGKPKTTIKKQTERTDKSKPDKTKDVKKGTKSPPPDVTIDIELLRKQLEERRREREEEKQKQKEEKEKERERKREERRVRDEEIRLWLKPRDDLECDDLKDMPPPTPVKCSLPNESFGDAVMILEFVHTFGSALGLKDFFPHGVTFETLEQALTQKDVNSSLCELLQFFLEAIFGLQQSEETSQDLKTDSKDISDFSEDDPDLTIAQALQAATAAASWPQRHQGMPLKQMPLDQYTLTEVLRLHLLSLSGHADYIDYRNSVARGNYTVRDDPALQLRFDEPMLLKALSTRTVFDLTVAEKLQLLQVLMNQLLTYMAVRNQIEETFNNAKTAKMELKQMQWAEQRQEREEAAARAKKLMEERMNQIQNQNQAGEENSSVKQELKNDQAVVEPMQQEIIEAIPEDPKTRQREAARKNEFRRKERDLLDAITKLQAEGGIQPLGRDRAYRRFWVFNSVPGLFVESDDSFVGSCLSEPTVHNPNSNPYLAQLKDDNNLMNSDKENKVIANPLSLGTANSTTVVVNKQHKLLSDNHPIVVVEKLNHAQYLVSPDDKMSAHAVYRATAKTSVFGMCTASDSCPVHGTGRDQRARWAFYSKSEELDSVFHSLNPRGFREGALRESLNSERQRLLTMLNNCPVQQLNSDVRDAESNLNEARKPSRRSAPAKVEQQQPSLPVEEEMEVTLREMLLDIEERIYNGSLGNLKVADRVGWREALNSRTYISSCDGLKWGRKHDKCLDADSDSGRGTPLDLMEQESTSHRSSSPIPTNQLVKDLASALLQIEQSVEPKYLKPPLGSANDNRRPPRTRASDADKKKTKKDSGEATKDVDSDSVGRAKPKKTTMERWEESLMMCTSLSQIFVHLSSLEHSIVWSRSALNAQCRICRRRGDAEHMLLCDDCDRGHHMYCLKPPLTAIPKGDWYCNDCKPRQPLKSIRSAPKVSHESEDDDDSEDPEQSEEDSEEADSDFDDDDKEEEEENSSDDEGNQNRCKTCDKPGTLICCDNCPLAYHLECVQPPLRRVPRGRWDCPSCVKKSQTVKIKGKRSSNRRQSEAPPVKRTRRSDRHATSAAESEDEIWLSGRRKQGPAVRRGASRDVPVDYKLCDQILVELTRHECSWPFLRPVGRKQVPQYYEVISRPVDLASMRGKLSDMDYRTTKDFILDVLVMLQNCTMYNSVDSAEYKAAEKLSIYFESYTQELGYNSIEDLVISACCGSTPSSPDSSAHSKHSSRNARRT